MLKKIVITAFAALALAACAASHPQSAGGSNGSSGGTHAAAATPSGPATWRAGGAFTGPWPPEAKFESWGTKVSVMFHDDLGYRYLDSVWFGPPLHYKIPYEGFGCGVNDGLVMDLPPGQYAVPVAVNTSSLISQEELQSWPSVTFGPNASSTLTDGPLTQMTRQDGSCAVASAEIMPPHGGSAAYALIGPLSANELRALCVTVGPALLATGDSPALTYPLGSLVPDRKMPGTGPLPSCK